MFDKTSSMRNTARMRVVLKYQSDAASARGIDGYVYVKDGHRLSDTMNDERKFLPFETLSGERRIVAKTAIFDVQEVLEIGVFEDPYGVLGVACDAEPEEIKRVYLARLKAAHPDRMASLKMDPDIIDAAKALCQKLNSAYDQIVRERRESAAAA